MRYDLAAFEALPIEESNQLSNNEPTGYTDLQLQLLDHIEAIHLSWWLVFACTSAILIIRFIVVPLLSSEKSSSIPPSLASSRSNLDGQKND